MPYERISEPPFDLFSPFLGIKAMPVVTKSDPGFEYNVLIESRGGWSGPPQFPGLPS